MAAGFNPRGTWQPMGRGFSIGVVQPPGQVVHFTGQIAWDKHGKLVGSDDVREQTLQCYRNIETVLADVGGILGDVVSVTTYFLRLEDLPIIQSVRAEYFGEGSAPASTSVRVAGLGDRAFLVELTPVAVVPSHRFRRPKTGE